MTFAVLVVQGGRVVAERYHGALEHFDREPTPVTAGDAVAQLVDGQVDAPRGRRPPGAATGGSTSTPRPTSPSGRTRATPVTPSRCASCSPCATAWTSSEDYVDDRVSDVIGMLFGEGQADMAHFAADRPLAAPPGHALQLLVGDVEHHLGRRGPHRRARASPTPGSCTAASSGPSGWRAPTPSSTRPAPGWPPRTSGPPRVTTPASACSTSATGCGTASGSCRPAGWTTPARWVSVDDPTDASPYGAHWWGRGRRHARHLPRLGLRGAVDHHLPRPRPGRRPPGQDAARARAERSSPWRAAPWCEAFADAR